MKRRGFTLIESMAVVAIIGILLSTGTYVFLKARRNAVDARRKSDLYALSQGFEARFIDRTCRVSTDVNKYPGRTTSPSGVGNWVNVSKLATVSDCAPFTSYLTSIKSIKDPDPARHYYFNLSGVSGQEAQHYRLMARLDVGGLTTSDCARESSIWTSSFGGQAYNCVTHSVIDPGGDYNYYLGR